MKTLKPLITGVLIKRYKRFLADVVLEDGSIVTAFCANTGSMSQVSEPGSNVILTSAGNPERKTRYDWQMTFVNGHWAGINTAVPNILLKEGFDKWIVPEFRGYDSIKMEVGWGKGYRADAVLYGSQGMMFVEAKNVTLVKNSIALFPDAATARGVKHLEKLMELVNQGHQACVFLLTQRCESKSIGAAADIDPLFAEKIEEAKSAGVMIKTWKAKVTPEEITLDRELPFVGAIKS